MRPIAQLFHDLQSRDERALVLFLTAGDQLLSELPEILLTLREGGADLIEVGIPFSDPFGEGPTIQASSQRSLDSGTTPGDVLRSIGQAKLDIPIVTMGYYNPILRIGLDRFAAESKAAGSSGTIVSDLVPDEADEWIRASRSHELDTIFLVAPTSTEKRLGEVCERSTGFVYIVSRTGVTGVSGPGQAVPPEVADLVTRVKARTDKPACVGFGISKPEHVQMVCQVADGAVVGSFLVDLLHREWRGGRGRDYIIAAVAELKAATRRRTS